MNNNDYESYLMDGPMIRGNISWSVKQASKMMDNRTLVTDNPFQRSIVWEKARGSLLIHSILYGFPIPVIWANKVSSTQTTDKGKEKVVNVYDVMDGKQRLTMLRRFLNDEYALEDIPPIMQDGELVDINGCHFSELPEDMQDTINSCMLTVNYYDNMSDSQKRELFKRLNNGKALNTKQRAIANCTDLVSLSDLGNHEFFQKTYTEKRLDARAQLPVVMKIHMMLTEDVDTVSFETDDMNQAMADTVMSDLNKANVNAVLNKALDIYNVLDEKSQKTARRKMAMETHLVSLVPFIKRAADEEIPDKLMADFIQSAFGKKIPVSDVYSASSTKGSAKNGAVIRRHEEIQKAWDDFFRADEDEVSMDEAVSEEEVTVPVTKEASVAEYRYGMMERGCSLNTQPSVGFLRRENDDTGRYFDIIVYNRPLTEEEMEDWSLEAI